MVRIELLRLRAMLLPEEELDEEEKRELEEARKEIKEGYGVNLKDLIKADLNCSKSSYPEKLENLLKDSLNTTDRES